MRPSIKKGIAKALAILTLSAMTSSIAHANDHTLSLPLEGPDPVTVHLSTDTISDANADPADILQVFVGPAEACCAGKTPIAGRYSLHDGALSFRPAFGFDAGPDYVARVRTAQGTEDLVPFRLLSDSAAIPAAVTQIYPSGDVLPENILRFYIHFSVPMKPNVAFDYIKLRDATGSADTAAFMRFKQELWSEDRTRLTVLMDPGRIKRGVATNLELGPALEAGGTYTIAVDAGWPTADGTSTLPAFSKSFSVGEPLRERPDVAQWQITAPCQGTTEPLRIAFDRPFDRHLLGRTLRVVAGDGALLTGQVRIADAERHWAFVPDELWPTEDIELLVSPELEDVAANNFRDLLDHLGSDEVTGVSTLAIPVIPGKCP